MTTAPNESITIPTGGTLGQYTVDWGDGTEDIVINSRATHNIHRCRNVHRFHLW